jgi:hypothetical protein
VLVSLNALAAVVQDGDEDAVQAALARHSQIVRTGAYAAQSQARTWAELRQVIQERTRTAAAEWKRMADLGMLVEVSNFNLFVQVILTAARECVTDKGMLQALVARVFALLPPEKWQRAADRNDHGLQPGPEHSASAWRGDCKAAAGCTAVVR